MAEFAKIGDHLHGIRAGETAFRLPWVIDANQGHGIINVWGPKRHGKSSLLSIVTGIETPSPDDKVYIPYGDANFQPAPYEVKAGHFLPIAVPPDPMSMDAFKPYDIAAHILVLFGGFGLTYSDIQGQSAQAAAQIVGRAINDYQDRLAAQTGSRELSLAADEMTWQLPIAEFSEFFKNLGNEIGGNLDLRLIVMTHYPMEIFPSLSKYTTAITVTKWGRQASLRYCESVRESNGQTISAEQAYADVGGCPDLLNQYMHGEDPQQIVGQYIYRNAAPTLSSGELGEVRVALHLLKQFAVGKRIIPETKFEAAACMQLVAAGLIRQIVQGFDMPGQVFRNYFHDLKQWQDFVAFVEFDNKEWKILRGYAPQDVQRGFMFENANGALPWISQKNRMRHDSSQSRRLRRNPKSLILT